MPLRPPLPDPDPALWWRPPVGALPAGAWFGLTTRRGGVSRGPYAALNLGLGVGDEERSVEANRARVRAALRMSPEEPRRLHQEHGRRLALPEDAPCTADGFLTRPGGPWVAVSAADCAAVAVVARDASDAALVHSGWRGAAAEIAGAAVTLLAERGHDPRTLSAAVSPCLHACCFEIGPEVADLFAAEHLRPLPNGRHTLDLPGVIVATLRRAGLPPESIHASESCTACDRDRFFSHRRDRGVTGRHWGLLALA